MSDTVWHYAVGNEQRGPINEEDVAIAIGRGEIGPDTLVWRDGMSGWAAARATLPGSLIPQSWADSLPPSMAGRSGAGFGQTARATPAYSAADAGAGGYYHPTSFVEVIKTVLSRYAQFSGRARRSEYWYWILFYFLGSIGFSAIDAAIFGLDATASPISSIYGLAILIPSIAVAARRLHDIGRSGWWQLIGLIPLLGWALMIWWMTRPSEPNDNQFGPYESVVERF